MRIKGAAKLHPRIVRRTTFDTHHMIHMTDDTKLRAARILLWSKVARVAADRYAYVCVVLFVLYLVSWFSRLYDDNENNYKAVLNLQRALLPLGVRLSDAVDAFSDWASGRGPITWRRSLSSR